MSDSGGKSTGAITGITNFLFLAFILPGIVYVCFILLLFPLEILKDFFPELEMGADVAIGAVVTLGLALTSIVFAGHILLDAAKRKLFPPKTHGQKLADYAEIVFIADRDKELSWYFWQVWGQSIMHENIAFGLAIIYVVYKLVNNEVWPSFAWSWRDVTTLLVVFANVICWLKFSQWYRTLMSEIQKDKAQAS